MSEIDLDELGWPYNRLKSPDDLGWFYRNVHKPLRQIHWGRFTVCWVVIYALIQVLGYVPVWAWGVRGWQTLVAIGVALIAFWPAWRWLDRSGLYYYKDEEQGNREGVHSD